MHDLAFEILQAGEIGNVRSVQDADGCDEVPNGELFLVACRYLPHFVVLVELGSLELGVELD